MGNSLTRINQARRERDQARKERDQARRERNQAERDKFKAELCSWFLLFLLAGFIIGLGVNVYKIGVGMAKFLNNSFSRKEIQDNRTEKEEDKDKLVRKQAKPRT